MSHDRELEEALRALVEESRRQLGNPPSSEEALAFHRGELSAKEAERIRDHLASDPAALDRFLDLIAHTPDPSHPDHLSDEDLAEDWEVIRRRLRLNEPETREETKPKTAEMTFWAHRGRQIERFVAAAALFAVAVLGIRLGIVGQRADELAEQLAAPRLDQASFRLLPDGTRGDATTAEPPVRIRLGEVGAHLTLTLYSLADFDRYRLAVHSAKEPPNAAPRWTGSITRQPGDAFEIGLPPGFLESGEYVFRVYGVGHEDTLLASYTLRLDR